MLPAARTTEAMTEELLGWAAQMPIFATHLTGVHVPYTIWVVSYVIQAGCAGTTLR